MVNDDEEEWTMLPGTLQRRLRQSLAAAADPERAPQMQAYMKSTMPYAGVPTPKLTAITRELYRGLEFDSVKGWRTTVLKLWREAKYREERYAAIHLTAHRCSRVYQTPAAMKVYETMIVSGAWWDYVDTIASHQVGDLVRGYPKELRPLMVKWSNDRNIWRRRTAILCQLSSKHDVDLDFLYKLIEPSLASEEFFLRKAIGWALRQVAWHNPEAIIRYVRSKKSVLSMLSKREALKNVMKQGLIADIP